MVHDQETYEDYYDYVYNNDDQNSLSYATDGIIGGSDTEHLGSAYEFPSGHEHQDVAQYNHDNYDPSYEAEFEDELYDDVLENPQLQREPAVSRVWNESYEPQLARQQPHVGPSFGLDPISSPSGPLNTTRKSTQENTGISLVPTSRLPDVYRVLFPFGSFNAVQSRCFDQVMNTEENMVVSAPTGSGKTVLFELAIVNLLMNRTSNDSKYIYISPTKALCAEKAREWSQKFGTMGIKCFELTGDTVSYGKGAWSDARDATIIVTTPEKLDSLSRNWEDHQAVFDSIKLMCVDEVHILGEPRGSTLEACLSRMKTRANCRFILVSATVPNASDIAAWIGSRGSTKPSLCLKFGEEYRPCKLTRHVYGYHRNNSNTFQFDKSLDAKLFNILQQHCRGKPTLIFCSTRKGVVATAERIANDYKNAQTKPGDLPWTPIQQDWPFSQQSLKDMASVGIGVHHAGLSLEDRRLIEQRFLAGKLFVVVATSTLAVGVNLPCHTVIIKGVEMWDGSKTKEYADLDIIQMIGRAGRPQFDKEGVAIILCDNQQRQRYLQLGTTLSTLESSLHLSLAEHINSEIVLGAITDVQTAHEWLKNTFLFKRIQVNPSFYGIARTSPDQTWESCFDDLVEDALLNLETNKLLARSENGIVNATAFGNIASRSYVKQASMSLIINLPENATKKDILLALSQAAEFKDIRLRQGERDACNKLCHHPSIRFEMKRVEKPHDKVFVLLQAVLGGISLSSQEYKNSDSVLAMEAAVVYKHATRLIRCFIEAAIARKACGLLKHSLELHRSLVAKGWEDRPVVLRQLEGIGEKSIQVLGTHGITTIEEISRVKPHEIEALLNRKPPFGKNIIAVANAFPRCILGIEEIDLKPSKDGRSPVKLTLQITCSTKVGDAVKTNGKQSSLGMTSILAYTSSSEYVDYRRISTRAILGREKMFNIVVHLTKPSDSVIVHMSPDDFAGVGLSVSYKPKLQSNRFPTLDTRPVPQEAEKFVNENSEPLERTPTLNDHSPSGYEMLENGNYACHHRCKDKTSCHHRCCQEGLARPPIQHGPTRTNVDRPRIGNSRIPSDKVSKPKSTGPRQSKPQTDRGSLLQQLDVVHKQASRKTKFKDAPRLTINPSRKSMDTDTTMPTSDADSLPDIDALLQTDQKASNELEFTDEEMEAAMAALPSSALTVSRHDHKRRRRSLSPDPQIDTHPTKRRSLSFRATANLNGSLDPIAHAHSDIIELDSSSESSEPVQRKHDPRTTSQFSTKLYPPEKISVGSDVPLFSRTSSEEDVHLPTPHLGYKTLRDSFMRGANQEGGIDFELDLSLFEGGEEAVEARASPGDQMASISSPSPRPTNPLEKKMLERSVSDAVARTEMQDISSEAGRKGVSLFDSLADPQVFERFFCDVEIE